jgi:DNA-directed RNA polymerase specialized sigma24 family protein
MEFKNSDLLIVINDYVHSERDRNVLKRRYVDGVKFESLAEEFDLSVRQVKNIIYKHEKSIFKHLEKG